MTSRNVIFYATLVGSLLPIGLWAACELAASFNDSPFVVRLLMRLPNLKHSDLWYCMALMIGCSLAIPAGRNRFNRVQGALITLSAALTIVIAALNLPRLLTLNDPDIPVRIAAHLMEGAMGGVVLLAFAIARFRERDKPVTDREELINAITAACLTPHNLDRVSRRRRSVDHSDSWRRALAAHEYTRLTR